MEKYFDEKIFFFKIIMKKLNLFFAFFELLRIVNMNVKFMID